MNAAKGMNAAKSQKISDKMSTIVGSELEIPNDIKKIAMGMGISTNEISKMAQDIIKRHGDALIPAMLEGRAVLSLDVTGSILPRIKPIDNKVILSLKELKKYASDQVTLVIRTGWGSKIGSKILDHINSKLTFFEEGRKVVSGRKVLVTPSDLLEGYKIDSFRKILMDIARMKAKISVEPTEGEKLSIYLEGWKRQGLENLTKGRTYTTDRLYNELKKRGLPVKLVKTGSDKLVMLKINSSSLDHHTSRAIYDTLANRMSLVPVRLGLANRGESKYITMRVDKVIDTPLELEGLVSRFKRKYTQHNIELNPDGGIDIIPKKLSKPDFPAILSDILGKKPVVLALGDKASDMLLGKRSVIRIPLKGSEAHKIVKSSKTTMPIDNVSKYILALSVLAYNTRKFKNKNLLAAMDIGGTNTRVAVFDKQGRALLEKKLKTPGDPNTLISSVKGLLDKEGYTKKLSAIGVSIAGTVKGNYIYYFSSSSWPNKLNLKSIIMKKFGIPVNVDVLNDADASLISAVHFDKVDLKKHTPMVITIGTGIGTSVIDKYDVSSFPWEGGSMFISDKKKLEEIVKGSKYEGLSGKRLEEELKKDLPVLARGVASLVYLSGSDHVYIGGGLGHRLVRQHSWFIPELERRVNELVDDRFPVRYVNIKKHPIEDDKDSLVGAYIYAAKGENKWTLRKLLRKLALKRRK